MPAKTKNVKRIRNVTVKKPVPSVPHLSRPHVVEKETVPTINQNDTLAIEDHEGASDISVPETNLKATLAIEDIGIPKTPTETLLSENTVTENKQDKKNQHLFIVGTILFGAIIILTILIIIYWRTMSTKQTTTLAVVTPAPVITPTPMLFSSSGFTLEIRNGSGVTGAAGKAAEKFRARGYTVVSVGNNDTIKQTQVYVTEEKLLFEKELLLDIQKDLPSATFAGRLKSGSVSAEIIIGKE